jgi:molybdopterin synthase sulfur carrier subunit
MEGSKVLIMISVKLFGIAKEIVGASSLKIEKEIFSVKDLLGYIKLEYPAFNDLTSLLIAINDEYATMESSIESGDEIALIPPVSGG